MGFCETCCPEFLGYLSKMGFLACKSHWGLLDIWLLVHIWLRDPWGLLQCELSRTWLKPSWSWTCGEGSAGAHHKLTWWVRVCKRKRWPWSAISNVQAWFQAILFSLDFVVSLGRWLWGLVPFCFVLLATDLLRRCHPFTFFIWKPLQKVRDVLTFWTVSTAAPWWAVGSTQTDWLLDGCVAGPQRRWVRSDVGVEGCVSLEDHLWIGFSCCQILTQLKKCSSSSAVTTFTSELLCQSKRCRKAFRGVMGRNSFLQHVIHSWEQRNKGR